MAGIIDRLLDSMKLNDDDDYDDDDLFDDEEDEEDDYEPAPKRPARPRRENTPARDDDNLDDLLAPEPPASKPRAANSRSSQTAHSNVVPMRTSARGMEVCMIKPSTFDDAREICETLLTGRAVVINLEGIHIEVAQRIIDFTSGACFSMGGNLQMISKYIFIVTPKTVELSGDFQDIVALSEDSGLSSISFSL